MLNRLSVALFTSMLGLAAVPPTHASLLEYVEAKDDSFAWKLKDRKESDAGTVYDISLTSQTWQKIKWEHQLQVYLPKDVKPTATMVLWNTGGGSNAVTQLIGLETAKRIKAPVAFLFHVPNQPIFDKKEDALIAETFVRYIEAGGKDNSWPLLFPMVKSVVRAMDALQAFAKQEWKHDLKDFIITGASKRGWTAWLTAATGDKRVKAIAPLVIDTLNMKDQMEKQLKDFGKYSEMIKDYTDAKLVPIPDKDEARKLWMLVDPWFYREKITVPKLIINGNNDPYWTTDALNLYWDGLRGPKYILYVPNAGHDLRQKDKANPLDQYSCALNGLCAFCRHLIVENPMPRLTWRHAEVQGQLSLRVETDQPPKAARIWIAKSEDRDFRKAKWESSAIDELPNAAGKARAYLGNVDRPKEGYIAFYAELEYEIDGIRHSLSTQIRVAGKQ